MRSTLELYLLLCLLLAGGCAPIQGYPGPERSDSELTILQPGGSIEGASLDTASVDGISFSSSGIALLPGKHQVRIRWRLRGPPRSCEKYSELDSGGYKDCLRSENRRDRCSCWDYLSTYERCRYDVRIVRCEGDFEGEAGSRYQLRMTGDFDSPQVEMRSSRLGWIFASHKVGLDEVILSRFLGNGFYTAVDAGVSATSACIP